jgi:hypothetical protein
MIDFLAEVADIVLDIILSIFSEKHRKRKALKAENKNRENSGEDKEPSGDGQGE